MPVNLSLFENAPASRRAALGPNDFPDGIRHFRDHGSATLETAAHVESAGGTLIYVPIFINEFWTSKQRAAHSIHEISYRACFKPQLPAFFIDRLTKHGDRVYDPFMGRGTTLIESALRSRIPIGCDVNPLSSVLVRPRLNPPTLLDIKRRLSSIRLDQVCTMPEDLLVFYHPETLAQICALREYFLEKEAANGMDSVDQWIRMVAINRLTGHSSGFFSVYTMPPNQAVSIVSQRKINEKRKQIPQVRNITDIILKKSKSLVKDLCPSDTENLRKTSRHATLLTRDSRRTPEIESQSVSLVVTSPPFLDIVDYATDNWLRCWFIGIDATSVPIAILKHLSDWKQHMFEAFQELARVLRIGGYIAFEVGEVRGGKIKLEEAVIPCAVNAGLEPVLVLINQQEFTKTANCWGVENNSKGTNTNRIVLAKRCS
ncbi:MAG: site-specific DNA-methyltransferase [Candidatus Schekmanbacteria bacterium]|nr:site-specific DNA-methyltransferase [Candidatus Schekmanbacteria bacterium]